MFHQHYDQTVEPNKFEKGNLVLQQVIQNPKVSGEGEMSPTWEGSYIIKSSNKAGSYLLKAHIGRLVHNP